MTIKLRTIFFKQDLFSRSVFISLTLAALLGAIVILCDGYKGDYLGPTAIIASYSFIADIILTYLAVSSLGKDFQNRTINMMRISRLSALEVLLRKLLVFILTSLLLAGLLVAELFVYRYGIQHVTFDVWPLARAILVDFMTYGAFLFTLSSLLVLLLKNTLTSFLTVYFGLTGMTFLTLYLSQFGSVMTQVVRGIPFSFMRAVFTSGSTFFTLSELLVLVAWTLVSLLFVSFLYKKRGFI